MLPSFPVRYLAVVVLATLAASPLAAQQYTGPSKCVGCHDHERQATKWQKEEPALFKDKAHFNTRKQLDGAKAAAYAKAIGLADAYDVKGSCVACHSTVFRGDANAGVSCESCHGPASGYMDPHQIKGSYAKSVSLGLRDLKSKPPGIAKACVTCHLTTDRKLVAAGHPSGAEFDVGAGLKKVVHWATTYDYAAVTAAGKAAMGAGGARAAAAAPAAAPAAAGAAKGAPPAAVKPGGGVTATGTATAGAAPPAAPAADVPAAARPAAAGPAKGAAAAPWDWDQPIRALPADYQADTAAPAAPEPAPAAARPARPAAPRRVAPAPSLAEDLPVTPAVVANESAALAAPPPAPPPAGPRSVTARVAAARGGAALTLARVLREGKKAPAVLPPSPPKEFKGPDGELLRLQDEAMALALEALRRP